MRRRWRVWLAVGALLVAALGLFGATRPRVANHFSYALPGADGLPTYVYEDGRRYQSLQVCAYADWCAQDRANEGIPRCVTHADLASSRMQAWPLVRAGTMFTLFGAPHDILRPAGPRRMGPYVVQDGPNCYAVYSLEGGP